MPKYYPGEHAFPSRGKWYVRTGEFREPRKGEFYLSGAVPHTYQAQNDLGMKFHIAIEAPGNRRRIYVDGSWYVLDNNQEDQS